MLLRRMTSSLTTDSIAVVHDTAHRMFRAVTSKGIELGHLEYRLLNDHGRNAVDFIHTFTRPEAQGKGVAGRMVESGLNWAVEERLTVIPTCSYVAAYLKKNPKYSSSL